LDRARFYTRAFRAEIGIFIQFSSINCGEEVWRTKRSRQLEVREEAETRRE